MSTIKMKLILTIPMFFLSGVIFSDIINNNHELWYNIILGIFSVFFIYEPIRILRIKTK